MDPREMSKAVADLLGVLNVARQLGATTDLDTLLDVVVNEAARVLHAERSSLFLFEPETNELVTRVAMGMATLRVPADRGLVGTVARTRQMINVPDAYADPRFNQAVDQKTGFRTRSILTVPLTDHEDSLVGVLQVLNKKSGTFGREDEFIASVLGAQAGVAIQRARLMQEVFVKKRMERDLHIARRIQQGYLPKSNPIVEGFDLAGWNRPADETGGDSYDFHVLENGKVGLLVADATGHGIGPALVISECRALVRALTGLYDEDVERTLLRVSHLIEGDLPSGHFVTAFLGVLDPGSRRLVYASAGQAPMLLYQRRTGEMSSFEASGPPLGILETDMDPAVPVALDPGDVFLVLTDGFFEWTNPDGEQFGIDRVARVVRNNHDVSAEVLIQVLRADVEAFARGTPQADDLTAVVIKRV